MGNYYTASQSSYSQERHLSLWTWQVPYRHQTVRACGLPVVSWLGNWFGEGLLISTNEQSSTSEWFDDEGFFWFKAMIHVWLIHAHIYIQSKLYYVFDFSPLRAVKLTIIFHPFLMAQLPGQSHWGTTLQTISIWEPWKRFCFIKNAHLIREMRWNTSKPWRYGSTIFFENSDQSISYGYLLVPSGLGF